MIGCTKTLYEEYITGFLKEQIAMGRKGLFYILMVKLLKWLNEF